MSHLLLTGTAGFIAARVAALLLSAGHTVVGVDNLNDAYDVRLKLWRLAQLQARPGFRFFQADIAQAEAVQALWERPEMTGIEAVINLAARAGVRQSVEDPRLYFDTNAIGTLNLLEGCRRHAVPKFVLASTSSLYGVRNAKPYHEDGDTDRPLSPYAASKKAAEALCHSYHYLHDLDVTIFRYFSVYGPAGRPDMSPFRFVQWISEGRPVVVYGDGSQARDFTYVDDVARGTILGLAPVGYAVVNLGSDRPIRLRQLIEQIERLTGRQAVLDLRPAHRADVPATWADNQRAGRLLGWEPQTPFEAGMQAVVEWYQRERAWASQIDTSA